MLYSYSYSMALSSLRHCGKKNRGKQTNRAETCCLSFPLLLLQLCSLATECSCKSTLEGNARDKNAGMPQLPSVFGHCSWSCVIFTHLHMCETQSMSHTSSLSSPATSHTRRHQGCSAPNISEGAQQHLNKRDAEHIDGDTKCGICQLDSRMVNPTCGMVCWITRIT